MILNTVTSSLAEVLPKYANKFNINFIRFGFYFASITKEQLKDYSPTFHVFQIAQWPRVWGWGWGWRL